MSDTDSFIDEVTEEVRRDRLFKLMRRYAWLAVLAVLVIVGGTAWNEWQKAQARAQAEAFGDSMMAALEAPEPALRVDALSEIAAPSPGGQAVLALLSAAEEVNIAPAEAAGRLLALADRSDIEPVYRQIATLKAVTIPESGLTPETRRTRIEGLALGGGLLRLLAEEQLAVIEVELGDTGAAVERLQAIITDAGVTPGLFRRASQAIVALGGSVLGAQGNE